MSQQSPARPRRSSSGLWVLIVVLLLPPVVLPLWVPLYDKTDPTLWGFPFFYWFQFALILMSAALTSIAFALSTRADRRREGGDR
jgi:Protein of unknown function (DUF3311)